MAETILPCPHCGKHLRIAWPAPPKRRPLPLQAPPEPPFEPPPRRHPFHLGVPKTAPVSERILLYLWQRGGIARVRTLCRALHCHARDVFGAIRLLEVARQVKIFTLLKGEQRQTFVRLEEKATPWATESRDGEG